MKSNNLNDQFDIEEIDIYESEIQPSDQFDIDEDKFKDLLDSEDQSDEDQENE